MLFSVYFAVHDCLEFFDSQQGSLLGPSLFDLFQNIGNRFIADVFNPQFFEGIGSGCLAGSFAKATSPKAIRTLSAAWALKPKLSTITMTINKTGNYLYKPFMFFFFWVGVVVKVIRSN